MSGVPAESTGAGPMGAGPMGAGEVGHKFARLETLRDAGFAVPEFFCVPVSEFDRALDGLSGGLPPRSAVPVAQWCAFAAQALAAAVPDGDLAARLLAGFDGLVGEGGMVAVRACVVPGPDGAGEDADGDPFAGLSDSFLYVRRGGLLEAVARCWASAFKAEAVRYREFRGIDPAGARVAVGVQRMVAGTRSFVAFTRDPRDGARRHVIAAAHGIGEGVVQERADVDHFFVDPATGRVDAEVVTKQRMVGPPGEGEDGPRVVPVPENLRAGPVLTNDQVRRVTGLAARVERLFGCPQDVEGAITPDGAVHLVQARPMAATADHAGGPRVHWGNHNITESFPGVSGALTYSQARIFYQLAFTDLYRRMGVSARRLRANGHRLARMVGNLDGRVYYRLDDWQELHGQLPVFDLVRAGWEEGMGITGEVRADRRWPRARVAAALPALAWRAAGHRRATVRFLRWWDALMADVRGPAARPLDAYSPDELITLYRWVWGEVSVRWGVTLANGVYGLLLLRAGTALLRRWTGAGPELLAGLLCGGPENRSLAAARAAIALAERAAEVPALKAALLADDLGGRTDEEHLRAVWDDVAAGRHGSFLAASARAYLRRFGDRAVHDLKLDEPTPRQRPWTTAAILRPLVRQGATVAANRVGEARAAADARRRLRESCPGPARRAVLRVLLRMMRWSVRAREDARFCRTQLFGLSREVMWRLGGELAAAGLLDDPLDVADLTVEEVVGAFDGTLPGGDLRGLAALRRAERVRNQAAPPPPPLLSAPAARPAAAALPYARPLGPDGEAVEDGTLRGLGSGGGTVRGRAKVVLDPRVPPGDCAGRILVARETDPGWLALMIAASGLVVERGTLLSHTAVTGRLLGVPTAVAVGGAVARIPDGAWIELDGRSGTVRILGAPAGAAG
ncbi:PEP/pyruvate-binding domain-containing protein [Actinomadura sp. NTSP31]|uniref:PEP/pyruvate-binding domain-containing protein n=1 Tax=Actinomadura sp. NTSP31 TaxID=1735447 RepID=UPI0035C1B3BB